MNECKEEESRNVRENGMNDKVQRGALNKSTVRVFAGGVVFQTPTNVHPIKFHKAATQYIQVHVSNRSKTIRAPQPLLDAIIKDSPRSKTVVKPFSKTDP